MTSKKIINTWRRSRAVDALDTIALVADEIALALQSTGLSAQAAKAASSSASP
jgi:hypothetical protein